MYCKLIQVLISNIQPLAKDFMSCALQNFCVRSYDRPQLLNGLS